MNQYSITDLEQMTGIKAPTLRMWEKRYAICCPCRDDNNVRQYTEDDLRRLVKIGFLTSDGHRISELAGLSCTELDALYQRSKQLGGSGCCMLDKLVLALQHLHDSELTFFLHDRLKKHGPERFIVETWAPAQERIGILILSGVLKEFHLEHFDQLVCDMFVAEQKRSTYTKQKCTRAALLVGLDSAGLSVHQQVIKTLLIKDDVDVVGLSMDSIQLSDWNAILTSRMFHQVYLHIESKAQLSTAELTIPDTNPDQDPAYVVHGPKNWEGKLPAPWEYMSFEEVLESIKSEQIHNSTTQMPIE